jgi:transposase
VADKGYHSRETLKNLDGEPWRSRIAEPKPKDVLRWHGDLEAQRAVYGNRARLRSGVAKEALKLRAERDASKAYAHNIIATMMRNKLSLWLYERV